MKNLNNEEHQQNALLKEGKNSQTTTPPSLGQLDQRSKLKLENLSEGQLENLSESEMEQVVGGFLGFLAEPITSEIVNGFLGFLGWD